jgi:NAD(P)-dependent dehydrogenase (short-subunit alcohol dehydrogenase family)
MSSPRNILIIGASRGIGLGFVEQLLARSPSAVLFATARNPSKAEELQKLAVSNNSRLHVLAADVTSPASIKALAVEIKKQTNSLDQVIYNSGVLTGMGNILDVGLDGLKDNMETNVYGAYTASVEFAPFLLQSDYPKRSLVLVSSTFGSLSLSDELFDQHAKAFGTPDFHVFAMYDISKTALNGLGKELWHVLHRRKVGVLLLHPGMVKTDMNPHGDTTVEESVSGMLDVIQKNDGLGKQIFLGWDGSALPW